MPLLVAGRSGVQPNGETRRSSPELGLAHRTARNCSRLASDGMTHMIEEYARHNGHVDLIRESIDGLTGE